MIMIMIKIMRGAKREKGNGSLLFHGCGRVGSEVS
jgi:hypothetical protein